MSAIQELAPYIEGYSRAIKAAKDKQGYTIQSLADESGVSYSAIAKLMNGTQLDPRLYNGAAICRVLGLSLDRLFGLEKPADSADGQQQRIHELELENARLETVNVMLTAQLAARRGMIYALLAVCALLIVSVIAYMVMDMRLKNVGLFQSTGMSILAVFLGLLLVAAFVTMAKAVKYVISDYKNRPRP